MSFPTTPEDIRDRAIAIIEQLAGTSMANDRYRRCPFEIDDFAAYVRGLPRASTVRLFQVRETGEYVPPEVEDGADVEQTVTLTVLVAYPHTHRYGKLGVVDRDRVMLEDQNQLEQAIGLGGRGNFRPPNADACWRSGSTRRIGGDVGDGFDLLELELVYSYVLQTADAASLDISGIASIELGSVTVSSAATLDIEGALAVTLGAVTTSATAEVTQWTVDATSGHAFPADATEHAAFCAENSLTIGDATLIWNMQEASGLTVADTSGNGYDGTLFATATGYAQTVSGFSRKAMTFADGTNAIQRLTSIPNFNANSCTAIVIAKVNSVGAASRSIAYCGTTQIAHHRLSAAPAKSVMRSGANVSGSGATTVTGSVRPFAFQYDRTSSRTDGYNDVDKLSPTHSTAVTGVGFTLGGTFPDIEILYVIMWAGATSKTEAELKAWLQAAGWSISW